MASTFFSAYPSKNSNKIFITILPFVIFTESFATVIIRHLSNFDGRPDSFQIQDGDRVKKGVFEMESFACGFQIRSKNKNQSGLRWGGVLDKQRQERATKTLFFVVFQIKISITCCVISQVRQVVKLNDSGLFRQFAPLCFLLYSLWCWYWRKGFSWEKDPFKVNYSITWI